MRRPYADNALPAVDIAIRDLSRIRDYLTRAGFGGRPLLNKIRAALRSAEGARRHQLNRAAWERRQQQKRV